MLGIIEVAFLILTLGLLFAGKNEERSVLIIGLLICLAFYVVYTIGG